MNKTDKRQLNLRNKLLAAIAMLLVSSIMMVSSTYAWFTLSTAPEVQGITTTIGANGNLEIALSPYSGDAKDITSAMGDANLEWAKKNTTWGNLLNLSDNSVYGLEDIALLPARLNAGAGADSTVVVNTTSPLFTPSYGADGRPQALNANTTIGSKLELKDDSTVGAAADFLANAYKGIRAIGTSANMSEYEIAFNAALSDLASSISSAKTFAQNSLNNNGGALTGMAIKHGLAGDSDGNSYSEEIAGLVSVIEYLENANVALADAIKAAALAEAASADSTPEKYAAAVAALEDTANISAVTSYITTHIENNENVDVNIKNNIVAAVTKYTNIASKLGESKTALSALYTTDENGEINAASNVTWAQVSGVLNPLMNTSTLYINSLAMSEFMGLGTVGIGNNILANGLNITMKDGSGVYSDFGSVLGNLEASVMVPQFSYEGTDLGGWKAYMKTDSELVSGGYMPAVRTTIAGIGVLVVEGASGDDAAVINVPYAYMVDFFFRTNASGSALKLQTSPAQRVYEESTSSATQGSGSTMTFSVDKTVLSAAATLNLMNSIRVVFMDTTNHTIYGIGKIDTTEYDAMGEEAIDALTSIDGDIYLHDFTLETDGTITLGSKIAEDVAELCELPANTAKAISVMVYLDGDSVTNADVANGVTSMMGAMNLQFASSADLVPMENSALQNMTGAGEYKAVLNVNGNKFKEVTVTAGAPYTVNATDVIGDADITGVTVEVTMGGATVTDAWNASTKTITIPNVSGPIVVNVTIPASQN